jgi:hypothetical protein
VRQKYLIHIFVVAVLICVPSLFAQPTTKDEAVNLPFTGVYRASAKTSIARTDHTVAPISEYKNLPSLLATLPKDTAMRSKYPFLKPLHHKAPGTRVPEEQRNVRIKVCSRRKIRQSATPRAAQAFA